MWKSKLTCNSQIDSPSRCTLAKATDQHHERGSLLAASAARFGPSALKVRSFWMDYKLKKETQQEPKICCIM